MLDFEQEYISLCELIRAKSALESPLFIALDGSCASGKTTLAKRLSGEFDAFVIHTDDFFLRPEQRTKERLSEIGGNIDYERLYEEISLPLSRGETALYRKYDCKTQSLSGATAIPKKEIYIVEGCYSLHPRLGFPYGLRVLLTVGEATRDARLKERSPDKLDMFKSVWIPLEHAYFDKFLRGIKFDMILHS